MAATRVLEIDGEPSSGFVILVSRVAMDDGRELQWHPPQPVVFSLIEAKRLCDRAVPLRRDIMANLRGRPNDSYEPLNSSKTLDVLSDLWSAVLHSFAALEAIANDSIDRLPPEAVVTVGKNDRAREIPQPEMVRRLGLDDKLALAVPLLADDGGITGKRIVGTRPWERYLHLKGLRDDLVHVKERGYDPDPDVRTAYDRLVLGDADDCARDAFEIVQAVRPGFIDADTVKLLSP